MEETMLSGLGVKNNELKKERTEKQKLNDAKLAEKFKIYHAKRREEQKELAEIQEEFNKAEPIEVVELKRIRGRPKKI